MSVTLEQFLEALSAKSSGNGHIGHCPAHDDRTASLSISEKDGKVLLKCHAGCPQVVVIGALKGRGLWPIGNNDRRKSREIARYDYCDTDRKLLYQVARFSPKKFLHYNPSTDMWSIEGLPRVPYRLPELLDAIKADQPVWIVEGEKDCETLVHLGLVATCNQGGTGSRRLWKGFAKKYFPAGTKLVLVPDADEPGLKLMQEAAGHLTAAGCKVKIVDLGYPVAEKHGKDVTDWLAEGHTREQLIETVKATPVFVAEEIAEYLREASRSAEQTVQAVELLRAHFLDAPSHGLAADILYAELSRWIIYDRYTDKSGEFYAREDGRSYYEPVFDIKDRARRVLEAAIEKAFALDRAQTDDITAVFQKAGKAYQKARTRDFLTASIALFAERVTVPGLQWNATPEAHATLTGVVDFSGDVIEIRDLLPGEYFRDPIPERAEDIKKGERTPAFNCFMADLFPDGETRQSALHCLGLAIANRPSKIFQIWQNDEGNAAKNTLADLVVLTLLPARSAWASGAIIMYKPDQGEKRFGTAVLQGCTAVFLDEVGDAFDIAGIKRLTSLSPIRVEQKGRDSFHIQPTWALIALCNQLPSFFPADDQAFLSRLFILPFQTVFYVDDEEREWYIKHGVAESRMKPARDKREVLAEMEPERAAIIHRLIAEYKGMIKGRPYESSLCKQAKNIYRSANDLVERFFEEYLVQDEDEKTGRVPLPRLSEMYAEFVGNKKTATRTLTTELKKRFRFLDTKPLNSIRYLVGAKEKVE